MPWETTNPSLLRRAADPADLAAWRELDAHYGPLVVGYCRSLGLQLADAEDVRQDVMMSLASALPGFRYSPARGRFRSYLGKVVRTTVARHIGRHAGAATLLEKEVLETLAAAGRRGLDPRWDEQWVRHHCRRALETLRVTADESHVDVFERLLAGAGIAEVATMFDLRPEAVRKIKQRIRDRLREIVAAQVRREGMPGP